MFIKKKKIKEEWLQTQKNSWCFLGVLNELTAVERSS